MQILLNAKHYEFRMRPNSLIVFPAFFAATLAFGQNLVVNGSFEHPSGGYRLLSPGSQAIPGWEAIRNGVQVFTDNENAPGIPGRTTIAEGRQAINLPVGDFNGGGIQQVLRTEVGMAYQLTFAIGSAQTAGRDGTGSVTVSLGGDNFHFSIATTSSDWTWENRELVFVADSTLMPLAFSSSQDPLRHFASIDYVQVVAVPGVPEPSVWALMGAGAFGLGGLAICRARKNE